MVPTDIRNNAIGRATLIDSIASSGPFLHFQFPKSTSSVPVESPENVQLYTIPTAPSESPTDDRPNKEEKKISCGFDS